MMGREAKFPPYQLKGVIMEYVYTLEIKGMMCGMCESHINETIRNKFDVKKVSSDRNKNETVVISKNKLDEDALEAAIKETGYEFISLKSEEREEKKGFFAKLKK